MGGVFEFCKCEEKHLDKQSRVNKHWKKEKLKYFEVKRKKRILQVKTRREKMTKTQGKEYLLCQLYSGVCFKTNKTG